MKKNHQRAGELLPEVFPGTAPSMEPTDWSSEEVARCKRYLDAIMREGRNAGNPDEWGSFRPVCPPWEWKPEYSEQYNAVMMWMLGVPCRCGIYDVTPDRGLWLCGSPGTGKSTLMKAVKIFCSLYSDPRSPNMPRPMLWRHAKDISNEYEKDGSAVLDKYVCAPTLIIDDLGTESMESKHYGTTKNPIEDVLSRRYDKGSALMTMATTNFDMLQVRTYYHTRIYDRVKEMFNIIEFDGSSHRGIFNPEIKTY